MHNLQPPPPIAVVLAIPWGVLTDRIGRKKVLLLALFGLLLNEAWARLVCKFL